jgi:L-gulonate 3-dehydrogenase
VRDYIERYQGIYATLFEQMQRRVDWAGPVLVQIEGERRAKLPANQLVERQKWRDRRLMALAAQKRRAARDIGT